MRGVSHKTTCFRSHRPGFESRRWKKKKIKKKFKSRGLKKQNGCRLRHHSEKQIIQISRLNKNKMAAGRENFPVNTRKIQHGFRLRHHPENIKVNFPVTSSSRKYKMAPKRVRHHPENIKVNFPVTSSSRKYKMAPKRVRHHPENSTWLPKG